MPRRKYKRSDSKDLYEALKIIEEEREKKLIGNSLEAEMTICCTKETAAFMESFEETLSLIFIVSKVNIIQSLADSKEDLKVVVKRASGEKCVRCWNFTHELGKDDEHPELCPRCTDILIK